MNKKVSVFIIVILLLVYGLFAVLYKKQDPQEENPTVDPGYEEPLFPNNDFDILVMDNISIWGYRNNSFFNLDIEDAENKLYNVFVKNNFYGKYYMKYGTTWNLFDGNNKFVEYDGSLVASTENLKLAVREYNKTEITSVEEQEITIIMAEDVNYTSLSTNEVIYIDLDRNGIIDRIVNVANVNDAPYYKLIYVVLNNEINVLIKENIEAKDVLITPSFNINYIFNLQNVIYDSIVIQESYFSNVGETANRLYTYDNKEYVLDFKD